ncbi:MAG: hypothetical protein Q4F07_00625 [Bacteroidales bacterium]|nr:hypothetical protein [Bacteroidales bacterium]
MRLTSEQMLGHWRRYRRLDPERADCSIELFDGINTDIRLAMEMRSWYLELLDNGDLRHLVLTDIAPRLKLTSVYSGVWQCRLPADVRRVAGISLAGAASEIVPVCGDPGNRFKTLCTNRYSRPDTAFPAAHISDSGLMTLYCAGTASAPVPEAVMAVVDPGDEEYVFNDSALALLYGAGNSYHEESDIK